MDTRKITTEYRMAHWAGILQERQESGQSVKEYCTNAGMHVNVFYYWQRKLREAAYNKMTEMGAQTTSLTPQGFMEVKLTQLSPSPTHPEISRSQAVVETCGVRVTIGSDYPLEKMTALLRVIIQ